MRQISKTKRQWAFCLFVRALCKCICVLGRRVKDPTESRTNSARSSNGGTLAVTKFSGQCNDHAPHQVFEYCRQKRGREKRGREKRGGEKRREKRREERRGEKRGGRAVTCAESSQGLKQFEAYKNQESSWHEHTESRMHHIIVIVIVL